MNQYVNVQGNHSIVAREVARDAITMLKNEDNVLPLSTDASLKLFGTDAGTNSGGINSCSDKGCDKGVLGIGWGSGSANYPYLITPEDAIMNISSNVVSYITDSFPSSAEVEDGDIAIVFINADSGENYITVEGNYGDRNSAGLYAWHSGDDLVTAAAAKYDTVVVVVHTVGPIIMEAWIDLPSVKSVLVAHLPGQEAGNSLTDVLFGDYSPSGHLPYTIPHAESDYPDSVDLITFGLGEIEDTFTEGLYIDYRYFDYTGNTPRYPFGHGLSYTNFTMSAPTLTTVTTLTEYPPTRPSKPDTIPSYSTAIPDASEVAYPDGFNRIWRYLYPYLENPEAAATANGTGAKYPYPDGYSNTPQTPPRAGGASGGNPALWDIAFTISVTVTNTGSNYSGRAVPQLYIQLPESAAAPVYQLRQFEKTSTLAPGESEIVELSITRKDLSVWDVVVQDWRFPGVEEEVIAWVGWSVGDLGVRCVVGGECEVV